MFRLFALSATCTLGSQHIGSIRSCFIHSCIKFEQKKRTLPFFFLFEGTVHLYVTATWISVSLLVHVWAGKGQLYVVGSWHQKCAVAKSLWHSDTPSNIPRDKRIKPGRLPRHVPSIAIGPQKPQANYQPPRGCPSLDLTGVLPCWLPFFTVPLVNLHLNWPCTGGWCLLLLMHVKKSQEPQRKCKYPLMALIQMDAPMTIGPRACGLGFFLSARNAEATTITQQNYACRPSTIDMLKSTASCYDN